MAIADHVQNCPQTSHPALSSTWTVYYRTGIGRLSVIVMEEHGHRGTPEQNFSEESLQFWGDTCKVCNHPVFHYQFNDENVRPNFGKGVENEFQPFYAQSQTLHHPNFPTSLSHMSGRLV